MASNQDIGSSMAAVAVAMKKATARREQVEKTITSLVKFVDDAHESAHLQAVEHINRALSDSTMKERWLGGAREDQQEDFRLSSDFFSPPDEFLCPLSGELMQDPVVISSGQTYDRLYIEGWFKEGKSTCPKTNQDVSQNLIPNNSISQVISEWCKRTGVEYPAVNQDFTREVDKHLIFQLLDKMVSKDEKYVAARKLRLLTKLFPSSRELFCKEDAKTKLLLPLSKLMNEAIDPVFQEHVISTLYNITLSKGIKHDLSKTKEIVQVLSKAIVCGSSDTKGSALKALLNLSDVDSSKIFLCENGAMQAVIKFLEEGSDFHVGLAITVIYYMCSIIENIVTGVQYGLVEVIVKKLKEGSTFILNFMTVLSVILGNQLGIKELVGCSNDFVPYLLKLLRETTSDPPLQRIGITTLHTIGMYEGKHWQKMKEEEEQYHTISKLAEKKGDMVIETMAKEVLEKLVKSIE